MGPGPESLEKIILRYLGGIFLEEMAQLCAVDLKGPGFAGASNTRLLRKLCFQTCQSGGKKKQKQKTKNKQKNQKKNFHHHNSNQMNSTTLKQNQINALNPQQTQRKATKRPH